MLFNLGETVMTRGVHEKLEDIEDALSMNDLMMMLGKHINNESDSCEEDRELNRQAIEQNDYRVVSKYNLLGESYFVITYLYENQIYNNTTVMLTWEY